MELTFPSGRRLFYRINNGSIDTTGKGLVSTTAHGNHIVNSVNVQLPDTTPDLHQAIFNIKSELLKVDPESFQKCANDLIKIQNLYPDPNKTIIGDFGCYFEIEKNVHFKAEISTILVERENKLVNEWIIYLRFEWNNGIKRDCCEDVVQPSKENS